METTNTKINMDGTQTDSKISKDALYEIELNGVAVSNYVKASLAKEAYENMINHGKRKFLNATKNEFSVVVGAYTRNDTDFLDKNVKDAYRVIIRRNAENGLYSAIFYNYFTKSYEFKMNLSTEDIVKTLVFNGVSIDNISEDEDGGKLEYIWDTYEDCDTTVITHFDDDMNSEEVRNFTCQKNRVENFIGGKCYRCPVHCMICY